MTNTEQDLVTVSGVITKVHPDKRGNPGILVNNEEQWYNKGFQYKGKPPELGDNVVMKVQPGGTGGFFYQIIEFDGEPNDDAVTAKPSPAITVQAPQVSTYTNGNGKDRQESINRAVAIKAAVDVTGPFSMPTAEDFWDKPDKYLADSRNVLLRDLFAKAEQIQEWLERPALEDDADDEDDDVVTF